MTLPCNAVACDQTSKIAERTAVTDVYQVQLFSSLNSRSSMASNRSTTPLASSILPTNRISLLPLPPRESSSRISLWNGKIGKPAVKFEYVISLYPEIDQLVPEVRAVAYNRVAVPDDPDHQCGCTDRQPAFDPVPASTRLWREWIMVAPSTLATTQDIQSVSRVRPQITISGRNLIQVPGPNRMTPETRCIAFCNHAFRQMRVKCPDRSPCPNAFFRLWSTPDRTIRSLSCSSLNRSARKAFGPPSGTTPASAVNSSIWSMGSPFFM